MRYQCTACGAHAARSDVCQVCLATDLKSIREIPPPGQRRAVAVKGRFNRHKLVVIDTATLQEKGWR